MLLNGCHSQRFRAKGRERTAVDKLKLVGQSEP